MGNVREFFTAFALFSSFHDRSALHPIVRVVDPFVFGGELARLEGVWMILGVVCGQRGCAMGGSLSYNGAVKGVKDTTTAGTCSFINNSHYPPLQQTGTAYF